MGRTSPFLHDGVQQYKRKWGLDPFPDPLAHLTAVWVGSDAARLAFAREPVLIEREAGLWLYAGGDGMTAAPAVPASRWSTAPLEGAAALAEAEWNGLARRGFHLHRWFRAAEDSGWRARHVVVREGPDARAVIPAYLTGAETPHDLHDRWLGPLRGLERIGLELRPVLSVQSPFSLTSDALGDTNALPRAVLAQVFDLLEETAAPRAGESGRVALRGPGRRRGDRAGARAGLRRRRRRRHGSAPDLVGLVRRVRGEPQQVGAPDDPLRSRRARRRGTGDRLHLRLSRPGGRDGRALPRCLPAAERAGRAARARILRAPGLAAHAGDIGSAHLRAAAGSWGRASTSPPDPWWTAPSRRSPPPEHGGPAYLNDLVYQPVRLACGLGIPVLDLGMSALYPKVLRGARLRRRVALVRGTGPAIHQVLVALGAAVARRQEAKERRMLGPLWGPECYEDGEDLP